MALNSRVGVISLGCAKNLVNTEQMMFSLNQAGFEVSAETDGADVVLLNTCGFVESAKTEAIEVIIELGEMKKEGRIGKIVVAGCLPERYKAEIMDELPEIDAAVGTGSFDEIVAVINSLLKNGKKLTSFGDIDAPVSESGRIISTSPAWAYLKVAEGCDNRCAYCAIPDIRGRYRSRPIENIVKEAGELKSRGTKELIIVAQDVTMYGLDLYGKPVLVDLLSRLCEICSLDWIRLHYLYPERINDLLINFIAEHDTMLKYLDVPIQHINDGILARMNRLGTGEGIRLLFKSLRERVPGVVLRTSVITGLPGEGEKEFDELCQFLADERIERAGVFPYSPEEGTPAALMDRPSQDVAMRRAEIIADLQSRIMDDYDRTRIGRVVTVLIEGFREGDGLYYGRSFAESPDVDGYIMVKGEGIAMHEFVQVRILEAMNGLIIGEAL